MWKVCTVSALGRCAALKFTPRSFEPQQLGNLAERRIELPRKLWLVSAWRVPVVLRDPEDTLRRLDRHAHLVVRIVGGSMAMSLHATCRRPTAGSRWKERLRDRRAQCYGPTWPLLSPTEPSSTHPTHRPTQLRSQAGSPLMVILAESCPSAFPWRARRPACPGSGSSA